MKSLAKLLPIGILAVLAIFLWPGHSKNETQLPSAPVTVACAPSKIPLAAPEAPQVESIQKPTLSLQDTLALIRLKLSQWRDARARDSQEDQDQLTKEMLALLTDNNVAQVMQALSPDELSTPFGIGALHHWMHADPVKAANWFASRPETTAEQTLSIADDLIGNTANLQQYIDRLPDTAWKQNFLEDAGSELATKDPLEAIKLAQEMKPGNDQANVLQSVACTWIASDPDAALNWIGNVSDPSLREQLIVAGAKSYALTDPGQAATWIATMVKPDKLMNDAALSIVETWAAKDPVEASNWVAQFPDGEAKQSAINIVLLHWLPADSSAATTWIQSLSDKDQVLAAATVASQWGMRDPTGAADWATTLPEGEARSQAFDKLVQTWLNTDPEAAGSWVQQLPPGASRDSAIGTLVVSITNDDPEDAASWASLIADPASRDNSLKSVCKQWLQNDSSAASKWIAQSKLLSPDIRDQLLKQSSP